LGRQLKEAREIMNKTFANLMTAMRKSYDASRLDFVIGYFFAVAISSLLYLILSTFSAISNAKPLKHYTFSDIFSFVSAEFFVSAPIAFILMLFFWTAVFYVGRKLKCNNMLYFTLTGVSLLFALDYLTSLGTIDPFTTDYISPSQQFVRVLRREGIIYLVMGLSFGLTFWSVLALRGRDVGHLQVG
jgi:hypothetical protein